MKVYQGPSAKGHMMLRLDLICPEEKKGVWLKEMIHLEKLEAAPTNHLGNRVVPHDNDGELMDVGWSVFLVEAASDGNIASLDPKLRGTATFTLMSEYDGKSRNQCECESLYHRTTPLQSFELASMDAKLREEDARS
ncbi:hypothetical protein QQ045_027815 [Rhodiola kirilowii]